MWAQVFALFIVHVLYQLPQPVNAAAHRKIHDEIGAAREYDAVQALLKQYYKKAAKRFGIASDYDPNRINQAAQNVIYDDGTEMSRNRKVLGDLFENDIVLTVEQAQHLLDTFEDDIRRTKRNAYPNPNGFWKNPTAIPYRFSVGEDDWKEDIRAALAHIESETCLRFVENGAGADSILFIRGSGCYSSVGRVGGQQQVSIGYGCESLGIVAHELTHALGFWHEQSRRDRDYNIWINFANIFDGTQGNFEIRDARTIDNMGQPYDLGSVMHYGSRGFSIRWDLYTIQTRDPKYQNTLGQRTGLAFIDAKQHNIRYCSKACPVALNCRNGGYVDPNNCNQCKCPAGLSGTYCMSVQPSDSNCGGDIAATYNWQEISNPNQEMYANQNCNWRIRAPTGTQILYQITNSDFGCQDSCVNYIEVKSTKDYAPTGFRVCCTPPTTLLASDTNEMLLLYHTDSSVRPGYKGFRLRFIIDGEPPATTTTSTTTTTTTTTTTPSTTTTTKTTTTTPEETTTNEPSPTPVATGQWGTWTAWGGCSISCGGCGISRRVRTCYGGNLWCKGNPDESKPCGTAVCPDNSRRCYGQIVAPCNLLSRIHFDRAANGQALLDPRAIFSQPGLDLNFDKEQSSSVSEFLNLRRRTFSRVRRRRSTCMSKFSYDCRSQGITLKITWVDQTALQANDQKLSQPCCVGFKENNGICVAE